MGRPEFTLAELVGYEDVEARSHEALASLVVHYYIDRYEYENKCIEKGNEIYENEILDEKSNKPIKDKTIYGIIYHCPNCRNEIDTENKYCPYCKSLLNWSEIE